MLGNTIDIYTQPYSKANGHCINYSSAIIATTNMRFMPFL